MGEAKPNLQLRGLRKDGTGMDLEASCGEVRFRGTPARIIGVRDITERRRMEELLKAQHGLSLVLSETVELGETMFIGMKTAMAVSGMDAGAIFLLDKETGEYGLTYHEGFDFALLQHPPWPVPTAQEPASGWSDAPLYLSPKDLDRADGEVCARSGIRSLAVLPVRHGGEVVAYIVMASRAAGEVPKAARLALKIVSDQIGVFILRVTREDAHRDAEDRFTRLFNLGPAPTVILSAVVSTDGSPIDFVVVDLNPAFEALTGVRYTSSGGKLLSGLLPRDATAGPALKALLAMSKVRSPSIQHLDVSWLGGKVVVTMVPLMKGEVGGIVERET
jgi:PAS domain-containing protein